MVPRQPVKVDLIHHLIELRKIGRLDQIAVHMLIIGFGDVRFFIRRSEGYNRNFSQRLRSLDLLEDFNPIDLGQAEVQKN